MTEVKRKKGESFESLLRRFNGRIQKSGRLLEAKKMQFLSPSVNRTKKKATALKRNSVKEKIDYMLKSGKIKEEDLRGRSSVKKLKLNK